jgi:hypothetical protein
MSSDRPLRLRAIARLGGHCVSETCRWHNADGTYGCDDERGLVFHHVDGGGSKERRESRDSLRQIYYEVLRGSTRFLLLCAVCHEFISKPQKQGANLHEQPARIRRSKQIEGQPVRRVRENPELGFRKAEKSFLACIERQKIKETPK